MSPTQSRSDIISALFAKQGRGLTPRSVEVLQPLWAGYGNVYHAIALPNTARTSPEGDLESKALALTQGEQSYVIKVIQTPLAEPDNEGRIRKILSYQVEQYFYTHLAVQIPADLIPIAQCSASINDHLPDGTSMIAMILSDLRQDFPLDTGGFLSPTQVFASLTWLSSFHGFWWPRVGAMDRGSLLRPPLEEMKRQWPAMDKPAIWLNGGYTYLATRRTEYASLCSDHHSEWRRSLTQCIAPCKMAVAEMVARFLAPSENGRGPTDEYQTLIHGDVKSDNLFSSATGESVVFYDFQYTGLGLGVCDLAKLFTCAVPLDMLVNTDKYHLPRALGMQDGEKKLLESYLKNLRTISGKGYDWDTFVIHWETVLVDWLRFQASWGFWGNTEWLEARVRWILDSKAWRNTLAGVHL